MPLLILFLMLVARANPHPVEAVLAPLPPAVAVSVTEVPGELRVWVDGGYGSLIRVRRTPVWKADTFEIPTCEGDGVMLYAPDLGDQAWVASLCDRLAAFVPHLPLGPLAPPSVAPDRQHLARRDTGLWVWPVWMDAAGRLRGAAWPLRPLHAVLGAFALLLAISLPRTRTPWLLAGVAVLIRVALQPPRVLLADDTPYAPYLYASGIADLPPSPLDGTWAAALGPLWLLTWGPTDLPHHVNLALSALAIPVLWGAVRRAFGVAAGTAAAVVLATLPLPVALARTEDLGPLASLLLAAVLLGAARPDHAGAWLTAASTALLAHLHPNHLPLAVLGSALLLARGLWFAGAASAVAVGTALVAASRRGDLAEVLPDAEHLSALTTTPWLGPDGVFAAADPGLTPIVVTALAVLPSLLIARGQRGPLAWWTAAVLLGSLPGLAAGEAADAARGQLTAQVPLAALAGVGWTCLNPGLRLPFFALAAASLTVASAPLGGAPFTWTAEHRVLRRAIPLLPQHAIIRFRPADVKRDEQQLWLQMQQRGVWRPLDEGRLQTGEHRWLGRADAGPTDDLCHLTPRVEDVVEVRPTAGHPADPDHPTALVGLYRVVSCPAPPNPTPPPTLPEPPPDAVEEEEPLVIVPPVVAVAALPPPRPVTPSVRVAPAAPPLSAPPPTVTVVRLPPPAPEDAEAAPPADAPPEPQGRNKKRDRKNKGQAAPP